MRKLYAPFRALIAAILALAFGLFWVYEVVDLWGTLTHHWVGNSFNQWLAQYIEIGVQAFFDFVGSIIIAIGYALLAWGTDVLIWFGVSPPVADASVKIAGAVAYLIFVGFLLKRYAWPVLKEDWNQLFARK